MALICLMAAATPAHAGYAPDGTVTTVTIQLGGEVIFAMTGTHVSAPCATNTNWVFDSTTPAGQARLAFLLNAQANRTRIAVSGTNTCAIWPDTEQVQTIGKL